MGKIILLNGPPSGGKDTAARHIRQWYNSLPQIKPVDQPIDLSKRCALDCMSMPIKRAFAGTLELPITQDGEVAPWESQKEVPIPDFGISYRQWQIDFSEQFLKKYDPSIFGVLLARRIERRFSRGIADLIVVPDCGFRIEVDILYQIFNPADILLVRCHREGFTFAGDSRGYVRAPKGCAVFSPMNGLLDKYLEQVEIGVRCWLETPERMPREE